VLAGGDKPDNNANIGSSGASGAVSNTIYIETGGSVILNSGTGAGARIGTGTAVGTGSVEIHAGGDIQLNGVDQVTAIRAGTVTLGAANIREGAKGLIVAGTLGTTTRGDAILTGPNEVGTFNASSGSDVTLNNTGALTVTGLSAGGNASLDNVGTVTISGPWTAGGTSSVSAHSDIVLGALLTSANVALQADGSITEFGANGVGAVAADTLTTVSGGSTFFSGENHVASYRGTSGADLSFFNRGSLNVTGLNASMANVSNDGALTISGHGLQAVRATFLRLASVR
jgi:hypothetical protein